ncbi:MAG: acyl-CoA/acyl-ACP dehydrogenase, partial [Planctomycetales bacterium]
ITEATLAELAEAGYWGLLVDQEYGGSDAPFGAFAKFLTRMALEDGTLAGLASVHGCIGAVDPVRAFGTDEQKSRLLPRLASGERLSAFALTEPGAGSDLTALKTTAVRDGEDFVVNGEKLFITNAVCGRTVGLVCLVEDRPAVLIADLPDAEDDSFQIISYQLYALKHSHNNGLRFKDFRVPASNLLQPARGDGLTIAYHGLNRGRVALCATAAGTLRLMLANMTPWASYRKTYGAAIDTRELVRRRLGRLAAMIVGCDALTEWCGGMLDDGYRGEMECTIAKIFASEVQKEAAIELYMKTHGGRSFLRGHPFGDNVHEYLAPCIYEGEGEILGLAFFKSLVKEHGKRFFEPIGKAVQAAGLRQPNPLNPLHAWKLRGALAPYLKWRAGESVGGAKKATLPNLPGKLARHAEVAAAALQQSRFVLDGLMGKHQLKLADRQCAMADASQRIQDTTVMLVAALWAGRSDDEIIQAAADVLCRELKSRITGKRLDGAYFRAAVGLGERIASEGFPGLGDVPAGEILMRYDD